MRFALTLFVMPFVIGGILLAADAYSWLVESGQIQSHAWLWLLFLGLLPVGVLLGALFAYGVLIFLLTWLAPNSPLLTESEVQDPGRAHRVLYPAFHVVRRLSRWLAPKRS